MSTDTFKAFYVDEAYQGSIKDVPLSYLPNNEVLIEVHYSSLNYKDALSSRGLSGVTKTYPHIPGIDAVGKVIKDASKTFEVDEWVIVTGNDLGTNTYGGFGSKIRVPKEWVIKKPDLLSPVQTMMIGTAGFTALYGIHRLQVENLNPDTGSILVTGATGGVGSFAVFALSQLGYEVVAATRKLHEKDFLLSLGAKDVFHYDEIIPENKRPLQARKWAGAIETVGGYILDSVLTQVSPKGAVACCGNVLGIELNTNILPFILRGISLLGIDSAFCIRSIREKIWEQAASLNLADLPENYFRVVSLDDLDSEIESILKGEQKGRVVIKHA